MPRGKKKVEDVVKAVEEKAVATEVEVKKATRAAGRKAKAKVEEAAEKAAEKAASVCSERASHTGESLSEPTWGVGVQEAPRLK